VLASAVVESNLQSLPASAKIGDVDRPPVPGSL
jgi:hypothetical protein